MIHPAPAHVGDVKQTIDAAQIDERAEVGYVLDGALDELPDAERIQRLSLQLFALHFDHLAAGNDDVAALFVDLQDHRVDVAADPIADFAGAANVDLRGRQENRHADIDEQPSLDLLGDLAGDGVAFLLGFHDGFPVDDAISFALADLHQTGIAFHVFQQDVNFIADFEIVRIVELAALEDAFGFQAELDDEVIAGVAGDLAFDN